MNGLSSQLAAEARRIEEDTEHSFKGHYNASARWGRYHLYVGLPAAVISAIAGAAAFKEYPALAGGLALLVTAMTTVLTFLKPSERAELHRSAAGQYETLRNQTRIFREIELNSGLDPAAAQKKLMEFARRRDELNTASPAIPRCDYELAKKDIDEGRSRYQVDEASK